MSNEKCNLAQCKECGRPIRNRESVNVIAGNCYHRYCYITGHTVASA